MDGERALAHFAKNPSAVCFFLYIPSIIYIMCVRKKGGGGSFVAAEETESVCIVYT
jgi:hypothetical protein